MIEFTVKNMSCGHCVATITQAVKGVDSQAQCSADLDGKRVRIESAMPAAAFAAALAKAGYPAQLEGRPG